MGPFNRHVGLRTFGPPGEHPHPPPSDPIFSWFFSIFLGFLGFPLLNQRIIRGVLGGVFFPWFFPEFRPFLCVWGLAIALTYPRRQKKGEKIAPWSHFFANFSNIPPDPEKFKGRSRIGVGGAKFSDANLRHFSREKWGRGFGILVNLGGFPIKPTYI